MRRTPATPAIATQAAVQRLPRWALLLLCCAYVFPGFVGRSPWKNADVAAFGLMSNLAAGQSDWLHPTILGQIPDTPALLPYWLGALAIQLLPAYPEFAVRVPFMLALVAALFFTWHAGFRFALLPSAQPVTFAFGGEALPVDYARSLADGGLLALLACLGLAQLSHETTPAVIQLLSVAMILRAMAGFATPGATGNTPGVLWVTGLLTMALSGAASVALITSLLPLLTYFFSERQDRDRPLSTIALWVLGFVVSLSSFWMVDGHHSVSWGPLKLSVIEWMSIGKLWFWFTWPVWPLSLWTLWSWRQHLSARHLQSSVWMAAALLLTVPWTTTPDRSLLLALPALAVLAAFSLPTLKRTFAALLDWFSVLFFSMGAILIWVLWVAMITGYPEKPAANVARLAPGFTMDFSIIAFGMGSAATLGWLMVVRWRIGRFQAAIWKSLILAATGSTLCWLLLMTLWLPLLDFGRSYAPISRRIASLIPAENICTKVLGLSQAQLAGLTHHGKLNLKGVENKANCHTLIVAPHAQEKLADYVDITHWAFKAKLSRLTDKKETLLLYHWIGDTESAASREVIN